MTIRFPPSLANISRGKFLLGLTTILLLVPIPAWAALDWTNVNWAVAMGSKITGTLWTVSDVPNGNSDTLTINPFDGSSATGNNSQRTIKISGTVTQTGFFPSDTVTPSFTGLNTLNVTAGSVTYEATINNQQTFGPPPSNQFSGQGPSGTQTGNPVTLSSLFGNTYNVSVTFQFDKNSAWSVSSSPISPITVDFNGT